MEPTRSKAFADSACLVSEWRAAIMLLSFPLLWVLQLLDVVDSTERMETGEYAGYRMSIASKMFNCVSR